MIISENPNRVTSRWLQACALLCATAVLPLGIAYAQDYEAVGKRLRAAVEAGELTGEQARAMLGALRKAGGAKKDQGPDRAREYLMKLRKELGAAVEAGKISKEDAAKKYEGAEKAIKEKMAAGRSQRGSNRITPEDLARVGIKIRQAVAEGTLSEEDGRAKMDAMRKMLTKGGGAREDDGGSIEKRLASIGQRLRTAVEAGKLTEEEAWEKWFEIKEKGIAPRLKAAVKAGEMTEDKAWAIWRAIEKGEAGARLKSAVEKGKITEEEARAKWAEINKEEEEEDDEHAGIKPVPAKVAHEIGKALLEAAPLNFAGDPSKAVGVVGGNAENIRGIILVPAKDMKEEETEMAVGDSEPLALLFCSPSILPAATGGTLIDRDKLHSVTITDGEGNEHDSNCMTLIVKRISEEDYRLYGIGKRPNKPLVDARFTGGEGPGDTPLALAIKDIDKDSKTASVVITVFNKYKVAFRAGVAE